MTAAADADVDTTLCEVRQIRLSHTITQNKMSRCCYATCASADCCFVLRDDQIPSLNSCLDWLQDIGYFKTATNWLLICNYAAAPLSFPRIFRALWSFFNLRFTLELRLSSRRLWAYHGENPWGKESIEKKEVIYIESMEGCRNCWKQVSFW